MAADAEIRALIALNRLTFASPRPMRLLMEYFGSATAVIDVFTPASAVKAGLAIELAERMLHDLKSRAFSKQLDKDLKWLAESHHFALSHGDKDYPELLKQTWDPPPVLFCDGDRSALGTLKLAMVGSRSPTPGGQRTARQLAGQLGATGVVVTSGLAIGIDGASHQGALDGGGRTIAVLGTGCDFIYPRRHLALARQIREAGLIMSEFPLGTVAIPANFPQRNRIVTGLCVGTLVVEAAPKSGSLISARLAMEQGREVFAVPGSIYDRQSRGCHQLIKQGARLTEGITDIIEELGLEVVPASVDDEALPVTEAQRRLIDALGREPVSVDDLTAATGLPVQEISAAMIELEINGLVERQAAGFVLGRVPAEGFERHLQGRDH